MLKYALEAFIIDNDLLNFPEDKMELRVLKYFLTIADEQNISKAADIIHITQPTLSRQIMELEDELGVKLFARNRQNRKFLLTDEGTRFYNYALQIVQLSKKTLDEFKNSKSDISGKIFIGAGETKSFEAVADAFKKVRSSHPKIELHVFSGDAAIISERLDRGLCDFAVFIGFRNIEKYSHIPLPRSDRWGLITRSDNPLAKYKKIRRENLLEHYESLMISQQALSKKELLDWFGGTMERFNVIGSYNLIYNATVLVKSGVCSTISFDELADTSSESGLVFVPLDPPVQSEAVLAWRKDFKLSRQAELLLEEIRKGK